jgi:hypothetical protein
MRGAPPVQMACGRDARWHGAECALAALAAGSAVFWLLLYQGLPPHLVLPVVAGVALGAAASWWRWVDRQSRQFLAWDGVGWALDGTAGDVALMIDLGPWMVLCFRPHESSPRRWLAVDLRRCGAPIHLCRAAVHAHAGQPHGPMAADAWRRPHG